MNFLAHSFLSGQNNFILIGNFIGDFVKGKQHETYQKEIQQGILLHRFIDSFTDNSAITKESKKIFAPVYGKYAGIIVDIIYDHCLSVHWDSYTNIPRESFIAHVYKVLSIYHHVLPLRAQQLIISIIYHNWMQFYVSFYGIKTVLQKMATRTTLPEHSDECIQILKDNYAILNEQFQEFFHSILLELNFTTTKT